MRAREGRLEDLVHLIRVNAAQHERSMQCGNQRQRDQENPPVPSLPKRFFAKHSSYDTCALQGERAKRSQVKGSDELPPSYRGQSPTDREGTAAAKAKLYCPIRLVQSHHCLLGALVSVELGHDDALVLVEDAKVHRRRHIVANPGIRECFVVVSGSAGVVQIWKAMTDDAKPGRGEAEAYIMAQRDKHDDASKLAVFPLYAGGSEATKGIRTAR